MNWNLSQWSIFQITNNFCLTKYLIYVEDLYLHIVCLHVFGIKVCFRILYITEKGLLRCSPTIICRAHITKHFLSIQPHNKSYKRKQFDEKKFHHKKDRQVFKSSSIVWGKKKKRLKYNQVTSGCTHGLYSYSMVEQVEFPQQWVPAMAGVHLRFWQSFAAFWVFLWLATSTSDMLSLISQVNFCWSFRNSRQVRINESWTGRWWSREGWKRVIRGCKRRKRTAWRERRFFAGIHENLVWFLEVSMIFP